MITPDSQTPNFDLICPSCQGGNPRQARMCMWCGTKLPSMEIQPQPHETPLTPDAALNAGENVAPVYTTQSVPPSPQSAQPAWQPPLSEIPQARHEHRSYKPHMLVATIILGALAILSAVAIILSGASNHGKSQQTAVQEEAQATITIQSQAAKATGTALTQLSEENATQRRATLTQEALNTALQQTALAQNGATQTQVALATSAALAQHATQTAVIDSSGPAPQQPDDYLYANETSHSVSHFAGFYTSFGGVSSLGYPLTELFVEQNPSDGNGYWVQYFEKGIIQYRQDNSQGQNYYLAPIGRWRFSEKYLSGSIATKPLPGPESYRFTETGYTVVDPFLSFWKNHGGVPRFGYPISESFEEVNDADNKPYIVQYFERAVLEYHPEQKPPYDVQIASLGSMRLRQLYPNGAPMNASAAIPSPTINATKTAQAIANMTATVVQAQVNATSTAVTLSAEVTQTAEAKVASANATATQKAYEKLASVPPKGEFTASGDRVIIACSIDSYRNSISFWSAGRGNKYIVFLVGVRNTALDSVHVNPYNFTLVSTTGATVPHDSATYSFDNSLQAVDIRPDAYTSGALVFKVPNDFIPGKLIWDESFGLRGTLEVTIVEPR